METVAGMTHIPDAPFGFRLHKLVRDVENPQNVQICYKVKKSVKVELHDVKKMYMTEMETLGWDLMNHFENEHELLLIFVRPANILCHVRVDETNNVTILILGEKKDRL